MARIYAGAGNHLDTTAAAISAYGFTMSVWIKVDPTQLGLQSNAIFTGVGTTGVNGNRFSIGIAASGAVSATEFDATSAAAVTSTFITDTTSWHQVTAVFNTASNRLVWLDGQGKTNNNTAKTTTFGTVSVIGTSPNNANAFVGKVCYATIWDVVLTDAEVNSLAMSPPWLVRSSRIVEFWPDLTGASPVPSLGNNPHNMVVTGTTVDTDYPAFTTQNLSLQAPGQTAARGPQYRFIGVEPSDQFDGKPSTIPPQVPRQLGLGPFYRGPAISFTGLVPGLIQDVPGPLTGNASTFTHLGGSLLGAGPLQGRTVVGADLVGQLLGSAAVAGSSVSTLFGQGAISGAGPLSGSAASSSHLTGNLGLLVALSGGLAFMSSLTGQAGGTGALQGRSVASSEALGAMLGSGALQGTSVEASMLRGAVTGSGALSGSSVATVHLIGLLALNLALVGSGAAVSSLTGSMTGQADISGVAHSNSEVRGDLKGVIPLSGISSAGVHLIGNLALNLIGQGIASYTSAAQGAMAGVASLASTNPALFSFIVGQMSGAASIAGRSSTFTHARGNLTSGIITSFQRVWVGDAMIAGTAQSVAVFSN